LQSLRQNMGQVQKQTLKMSQQQIQSIQLLAMPLFDLRQKIQEELESNPALEMESEKGEVSLDDAPKQEEYDFFENTSDPGYNRAAAQEAADNNRSFIEGVLTADETLREHLLEQLHLQPISKKHMELGELLIQNLNEDGFHIENPETLLSSEKDLPILKEMMQLIQRFDPIGTCTKDYSESLIVQAQLDPSSHRLIEEVVLKYFPLLKIQKHDQLMKKLKIDEDELDDLLFSLKLLNPFPGRQFSQGKSRYVIPDLSIRMEEGEFRLFFNDESIPVLKVSPFFEENPRESDKETKKYIKQHKREAEWFIRSIQMRNKTLLRVAKAIVEFQRDFFVKGPKFLVPLTLKDIAQEVEVHETTVSRVCNGKYIQTEWGIFELKHFFTNSISGTGSSGSRFSKEGVKEIIREIILASEKKLSDQKISDILKKRGIDLARRTVSKYRKEMDIDSSYER
jgi:RNA polymerase sigma-54 factor